MADPSVAAGIALPPKEAIEFFRQKTNQTTERWSDVWNEAHARAFSVAGAASEALVEDFRREVARALEQGVSLAEFRKSFDTIVETHGWVHNGTPAWRAQIIYETNLSTAYSAGRYVQMTHPDVLEAYPFWRYQHNAAVHPRQQHLDWSGLTLRADDPWWATHYPPNGWRCHCSVSPVSERGLDRMGKSGPDTPPPLDLREVRIRQSLPGGGDEWVTKHVPRGIDPGFGYNPGASWQGRVQPGEPSLGKDGIGKPAARPRMPPAEAVPTPPPINPASPPAGLPELRRPPSEAAPAPAQPGMIAPARPPASVPELSRFLKEPIGEIPVGVLHPDVAEAIGAKQREVTLSADTVEKQLVRHPDLTLGDYLAVAELVADPALVVAEGERHVVLLRYAGHLMKAVVKRTGDGAGTYLVSLTRFGEANVAAVVRRGRVVFGSLTELLSGTKKR